MTQKPQYVAMELGFFEEENIEIVLDVGNGADTSMTALISGSADIALLGTEAGIYVYKEGMENYPKSFIQLTQRAGNFLISREENNNFNWSDLIGSSIIGGRAGGMPQMVLEYVLKENNITPFEDVEIIDNLDFTSTAGAFAGEIGDYTVEFEPVATTMESSGIGYIVQSIGESAGELPYTVYMATEEFLEEKPQVLESFTKAIYKGQQWVYNNKSEDIAKVILPQFPDTDIDTLTTIVERYKSQNTWTTTPKFSEEGFSKLQDIMIDGGVLDEKVDFNELVTNEFAEKVIE